MPRTRVIPNSLLELLNHSSRPIYAIDARRRIVYCNSALATWLELEPARVIGRLVEYHSEPEANGDSAAPLADLCPPPRALAGQACAGTISCAVRGGRLAHRYAEFIPLHAADNVRNLEGCSILVLLGASDLTPQELAADVAADPTADELHRTIRRFRRAQAGNFAIESLFGGSTAMQKVRAQAAAVASSGANALICGSPGTGRGHVARAIHYRAAGEAAAKLVPVNCEHANDDALRRALDALRSPTDDSRHRPTLLLENLDRLDAAQQSQLLAAIRHNAFRARVIATCGRHTSCAVADALAGDASRDTTNQYPANGTQSVPATLEPALLDFVSTITINVPRLVERLEDLPILAQSFLESCNRGSNKQIGSYRTDALDQLALYAWPGELAELREVIAAAHAACSSREITPADLPAVIHHASQAASRIRKRPERIVLDELLAQIEREAIVRALAQADGNKTEAADMLGMTRPRLYRRLVQLGLVTESKDPELQMPEFVERPTSDEAP
jgi:DNA-binding NtrC family response regulator